MYLDPPYFKKYSEYNSTEFNHAQYIEILNSLRMNKNISLIHSNSIEFKHVYDTNEKFEIISCQDRMNSKNMSGTRLEVLYYL